MSAHFLVEIHCVLKFGVSQEFIDELKKRTPKSSKPLRDFPGWSEGRIELIEKWENHSCYNLNLRFEVHEDVFFDAADEFFDWIAADSETQGFVGIAHYSLSNQPDLIFFENGKARLWDVRTYDPDSWASGGWEPNLDKLKKDYEKACQLLKQGYEQKVKEFEVRIALEEGD